MPVRNTVRFDIPESYYHVYNRGLNAQTIYGDDSDKDFFLWLIERYAAPKSTSNQNGYKYKNPQTFPRGLAAGFR
jgi:hypothetical protein